MFRWIREAFGHKPGGVHTRIATFRPKAPPPDPRAIDVEFTGRELYGGKRRLECGCINQWGHSERERAEHVWLGIAPSTALVKALGEWDSARYNKDEARRTWGAAYADLERQSRRTGMMPELGADFERVAEEHDADRYDAASY